MKAKLMFKTVHNLALRRLCNIFQNLDTITDCNSRGSSTRLSIPGPRTRKVFVTMGHDVESRYPMRLEVPNLTIHFAKSFLPRSLHLLITSHV